MIAKRIAFAICALSTLCFGGTPNDPKVDALFKQWDRIGSPGAAIVVVKDGAVVYQHGYGYANLENRIPITPQTRFDVASVAKQFTGLSIAMLIEEGKISLNDDVRKYLPDVPDFGKPITIAHLVHHTSGLRDWPETLGLSGVDMEAPISLAMILEMLRRQRELDFVTGDQYQYSNTGYNLLAAIVAKVAGKSFRAWTEANVFGPLDMKHTLVCENPAEIVSDLAESYGRGIEAGKFHRVVSQLSAQGSSSLFISAEDMGKWLLNFETAKAGGRKAVELMCQPGKLNRGGKVEYGFGLSLDDYRGGRMFQHSGGWAGYRSFVMFVPEKRFAVGVLANTATMNTYEQAMKIADLYLGTESATSKKNSSKAPAAIKGDPASWDAFLGTYRLGPNWLLNVTREGDQLMAQASREDKFKMTPTGTNTFFVEAYGQPVEFVRQLSGSVTNLIYRGNRAPKVAIQELNPAKLAEYVGDYWSEELRVMVRVEIHDGKLATRHRSGIWLQLLPGGDEHFDAGEGGFTVEFTRGPDSGITEARVSGGRVRNIRYTRVKLSPTVEKL